MEFTTIQGLYLLGFLLPFLLLYLIRNKANTVTVPSLQFFLSEKQAKKYNAFLQKLIVRTLFFIQLLCFILLALSATDPIITVPQSAHSLNTVVVMDMSASMSAKDTTISRFEEKKQDLLKEIKGKTTIILAEESPVVLATNVSARKARALITHLDPKDIPTRIDSAIVLAAEILGDQKGSIVVYSDFLVGDDDDLLAAKKIAEASNKRVVFVQTGKQLNNVGFIDLNIFRGKAEAFVKNFGFLEKEVQIKLKGGDDKEETRSISIPAESTERIAFELTQGSTTLELVEKDRFTIDDTLYISNPNKAKLSILFITNKKSSPLLDALQANAQFSLQVANPPVIPDLTHDVVVVHDISKANVLPNTFREINQYREKGGKVILMGYEDLAGVSLSNLMNGKIDSVVQHRTEACVEQVNEFTRFIASPRCFSSIDSYLSIETNNGSIVVAQTKEGSPLMILEKNLLYYGIIRGGFEDQISYPLFWDAVINFLLGRQDIANFNFRSGDLLLKANQSQRNTLDNVGFSTENKKRIAINLLDESESDLARSSLVANRSEYQETIEKVPRELNLGIPLLIAASLLLIIELLYVKRRGDL